MSENENRNVRKSENDRRIELGMLGLLVEKYPKEAKEKVRKLPLDSPPRNTEKTLVLRE